MAMNKQSIEQLIDQKVSSNGMIETEIKGVQLFKLTDTIECAPAVYEPSVTAIVRGGKEAIWNGKKHLYDNSQYICCTMSIPIETGAPTTTPVNPLIGVYITLDTRLMTDLAIEIESASGAARVAKQGQNNQGLSTSTWNEDFT